MSVRKQPLPPIPEDTVRVARSVYRKKKNMYVTFADEVGEVYDVSGFEGVYSKRGQPALNPVMLVNVILIQFIEGLSDRQVVEAIRSRIDLKYFLHLPLDYDGFDPSVLAEFRQRLVKMDTCQVLLDRLLEVAESKGLLKPEKQRTDSTHILASVRDLNRLELVSETMRVTLEFLADWDWQWLSEIALTGWDKRYGSPCFNFRIPKTTKKKAEWIAAIGRDGYYLLEKIDESNDTPLKKHKRVAILRKVWEQQFVTESEDGKKGPRLRSKAEHTIASSEMIVSPRDDEARLASKRGSQHKGYKGQFTETYNDGAPHLITHVETTPATVTDVEMRPRIERCLKDKGLLPAEHLVDSGYTDVTSMIAARQQGINVIGPMRHGTTWQEKADNGFQLAHFRIDWDKREVVCPAGKTSENWSRRAKESSIHVKFRLKDCSVCPFRKDCTKSTSVRTIQFKEKNLFEFLDLLRKREQTEAYKKEYAKRAGIEGTISQTVRRTGARRARYAGLAKTRLQMVASAVAVNVVRMASWLLGVPLATTRQSRLAALGVPA